MDLEPGTVWSSAELRAADQPVRTVRRAVKAASLQRVRRGRYSDGALQDDLLAEHRRLILDVAREVGPAAVVSHLSAAILHGRDAPAGLTPRAVHLTWPGAAGRGRSTNIHPHRAMLDAEDVLDSSGIRVTTAARTVYDLARSEDQRISVSVADAFLRDGLCTREDFAETLERAWGRPGSTMASEVMAFADPLSSGDLQSQTRVMLGRLGIPRPRLAVFADHPVYGPIGPLDFEFPDLRGVLCCDDRAARGRCPERDALAETVRETGRQMAWVGAVDLRTAPDLLLAMSGILRAAGALGRRRPPPILLARSGARPGR